MSVRWILASGREEDKETPEPLSHVEIVVLKTESEHDMDDNGYPDTLYKITYALAGNDDLLGWELIETGAFGLYLADNDVVGIDATPWALVPDSVRRRYIRQSQTVLARVAEHMREKRDRQRET